MGNSASVNNVSLLDQRRYQSEFLRYSQIPYDGKYQHQNIQNFDVNQTNHKDPQQSMMNAMKVLPEIKLEPKLKVTNNGAILSAGGTISGQKSLGSNLHRSKSISEAQNPHPINSMDIPTFPPPFKMSRASTQLSINLQKSSMGNSKKIFNSSYNLNNLDLREKAERDERKQKKVESFINGQKKSKPSIAPSNIKSFNENKIKMVPPPTTHPPAPPIDNPSKSSSRNATRMFGDTLKNSRSSMKANIGGIIEMKKPSERTSKVSVLKVVPPSSEISIRPAQNRMKVNPVSYLRREKTFDLSLMQSPPKEKYKVHLSPQLEHRNTKNTPKIPSANLMQQERFARHTSYQSYKNPPNNCKNESPTIQRIEAMKRTSVTSKPLVPRVSAQIPKDLPGKPVKREPSLTGKCKVEKKTSINSAISNPTMSANSSFKFSAPPMMENSEVLPTSLQIEINNDPISISDQDIVENLNMNNFYFGMNEACVDSEDDDRNDIDSTSLSAINLFAENIFKMNNNESRTENTSQDSSVENGFDTSLHDIALNLRPTLPRRQLEIPRFSPVAAWKSLSIESNLMDSHNKDICISFLNISDESAKQETEIERVYREPSSFNMYQLDAKSGDSGISADKEEVCNGMNNSPTGQIPQSYLMPSWTPQQDLEGDEEESIDGNVKENFHQNKEEENLQHFPVAPSGHMFSLSLPRDNQYISDSCGLLQNNFYTLQKFRKSLVEVFSTDVVDGKTHFVGDGNWLLSSQPNSIDDLRVRREPDNQLILQAHHDKSPSSREHVEQNFSSKSKSKYKFKFQSTIRQTERKKIAEKLSREAEKKEMHRLGELEAMQKVEEEFQRKRAREKNFIQQQLRIASMEVDDEHDHMFMRNNNNNRSTQYAQNYDIDSDDEVDTRTPYIYKIIEAKSSKSAQNK